MANILVVDDDNDLRPLLKITLSKLGHSPTLATRGEEGLALALSNKFDLIILDLMMPDKAGYEVRGLVDGAAVWFARIFMAAVAAIQGDRCSFLRSEVQVTGHPPEMVAGDHRPHINVRALVGGD